MIRFELFSALRPWISGFSTERFRKNSELYETRLKRATVCHRGNLGCRNGMGGGGHAQPIQNRGTCRTRPLRIPNIIPGATPIGSAESNRDTLAVNLSRCAHRPARVMAGTAVGTPSWLGIPGLNGRKFLPKGHLLRLMIALSVL